MTLQTDLIGDAGVYYVAYQLSARGYTVGILPQKAKFFDLVVVKPESGKSLLVQVKTAANALRYGGDDWRIWTTQEKVVKLKAQGPCFLTLVDLCGAPPGPRTPCAAIAYIVPWSKWNEDPDMVYSKGGYWFNIGPTHEERFRDRWDLIEEAFL
jgi:hypothetical protein